MHNLDSYNLIDLFIIGTLLITLILGVWKGFVRSLTALASLAFGVVLSAKYYPLVQPYLSKVSSLEKNVSMILSIIIIFVVVQVVFVGIRRLLDLLLDLTHLTWLDRVFGALMGAAGGFLVVAASVEFLLIGVPDWPMIKTSRLAQPVDRLTEKGLAYAPKEARDQMQSLITKWKGPQDSPPLTPQRQAAAGAQKAPAVPPRLVR